VERKEIGPGRILTFEKKNLEETSNIARTKAQATIAISRLVGAGKLQVPLLLSFIFLLKARNFLFIFFLFHYF
jgi:hypothetical protein